MGFFDIFRRKKAEIYKPIVNSDYLKDAEIYIPAQESLKHYDVMHIELDYAQAIKLGWHFRRKSSKSVRITRYTGGLKNIIIPSKIGEYTVNEIGGLAFQQTDIDYIQIPDTVKKLNERCFFMSKVKSVTFTDGVEKIPAESFSRCENLTELHLPNTLWSIEKRAFFYCTSLKSVNIPNCDIGDEAFRYSGIEKFTYLNFHFNGKAFGYTPMQKKYKIITAPSYYNFGYNYNIKLVGKDAEIKFPAGCSVYLAENSVTHDCTLDFSACRTVSIHHNAFVFEYDNNGLIYSRPRCSVIMPKNHKHCYFPEFVDVHNADGSEYEGIFENKGETADGTVIHVHGEQLPSLSLNHHLKNIVLESDNSVQFYDNAVSTWELESFSSNCLYGKGALFSPFCHNLHKVSFKEKCVYIPSCEMINKETHCRLLKAFSGRNINGLFHFFDDSIIDDVFRDYRLSQMSRIFLAVDVLRSTGSLFGNRDMYVKYLKNHRHYAEIIYSRIPEKWHEYSDFLKKFY